MTILEQARRLLKEQHLCLNCLGRLFGALSVGHTNEERGRAIITALIMEQHRRLMEQEKTDPSVIDSLTNRYGFEELRDSLQARGVSLEEEDGQTCEICDGLFQDLDEIASQTAETVKGYDFATYQLGVSVPSKVERREDEIRSKFELKYSENIRSELSREIGKMLSDMLQNRSYSIDPVLKIELNPYERSIETYLKPVAVDGHATYDGDRRIFGKVCKNCQGNGCERCKQLGRIEDDSFEYVVGKGLLDVFDANSWAFNIKKTGGDEFDFHFSISNPKTREVDPKSLTDQLSRDAPSDFDVSWAELEG